jgi:ribonuclease-3
MATAWHDLPVFSDDIPSILMEIVERAPVRETGELLLEEAFTHRTFVNENHGARDNQRLEFLGDAILDLAVSQDIFARMPDADEGLLSRARAAIVNQGALAVASRELALGKCLRLGRGERASGGHDREGTLADLLESVVGAVFLMAGFDEACVLVQYALGATIDRVLAEIGVGSAPAMGVDSRAKDPKSVLQELVQKDGGPPPIYLSEVLGLPPRQHFVSKVTRNGDVLGVGEGSSRREADRLAAEDAISKISGRQYPHEPPQSASQEQDVGDDNETA